MGNIDREYVDRLRNKWIPEYERELEFYSARIGYERSASHISNILADLKRLLREELAKGEQDG